MPTFREVLSRVVVLGALSLGCAAYRGTAVPAAPSALVRDGGWTMVHEFPLVMQRTSSDCGAAALRAVLDYWRHPIPEDRFPAGRLRAVDVVRLARDAGISSYVFFGNLRDVSYELERGRPVIVGLGKRFEDRKAVLHYEVVVGIEPRRRRLLLLDPGRGWQVDTFEGFGREWASTNAVTIVAFAPATKPGGPSP